MQTSKAIILVIALILFCFIFLLLIRLLTRKLTSKEDQDQKIKRSYGIWISALLISTAGIVLKSLNVLSEAIDNIQNILKDKVLPEVAKTTCMFIGLSALWFLLWFYLVKYITIALIGARKDKYEFELDNLSFFLIKGVLLCALIICSLPALELILRLFIPVVKMEYYH